MEQPVNGLNGKLTNKQIAITRLVDARFYGYTRISLSRSSISDIHYLIACVRNPPTLSLQRMNICAVKRNRKMEEYLNDYKDIYSFITIESTLPLETGLELVENFYWFLTYNRKDLP